MFYTTSLFLYNNGLETGTMTNTC